MNRICSPSHTGLSVIHRLAAYFPEPQEFRPERFLGDDPPDTYTRVPFGGGTRRCLGASFAQFEMRVVIERVIARTRLDPVGERPEPAVRAGITLVPKTGTRVVVRERRDTPVPPTRAASVPAVS